MAITTGPALASEDAARALAERFAGGASAPADESAPQAQPGLEEQEILDRARAEAAVRESEAQQAAELKRKADAEKATAKAERVRAEQAEADRLTASQLKAKRDAEAAEEAARLANAAADDVQARAAEVDNLAEKLNRVREARPSSNEATGAMGLGMPPSEAATPEPSAQDPVVSQERRPNLPAAFVRNATSVTILLVMEPGTNGIRRGSKTADPVLCLDSWCYVSNGPSTPAKLMSRAGALGPLNTLGQRAGACRQSLTCVYRGIDVAAYYTAGAKPASLQPVDLRYLHHDRREPMPMLINTNCTATPNKLVCGTAIKGKGWTAWIVPEDLAVTAGVEALQAALAGGLVATPARAASLKFFR